MAKLKRTTDDSDLVFSSDHGDLRRDKSRGGSQGGRAGQKPDRAPVSRMAPAGTTIKVKRETSGRKGKTATTITDLPFGEDETRKLARQLKRHCGVGGTSRGSSIELQGDHRDKVIAWLERQGHRAVRAGG